MTTRYWPYRSGDLYAVNYSFEHAGDSIPTHAHENSMLHNVEVIRGAVRLSMEGADRLIGAGQMLDFNGAMPHEIVALEPKTLTRHWYLFGIPPQYATLTDEELSGIIDAPIKL